MRRIQRRIRRTHRCRITQEWTGSFIGRWHCHTHDLKTDSPTEMFNHLADEAIRIERLVQEVQ